MNGRVLHKRAYYLAVIASAIKEKKSGLNIDVLYGTAHGDPRLTCLILQPKAGNLLYIPSLTLFCLLTRTSRRISNRLHETQCRSSHSPNPPLILPNPSNPSLSSPFQHSHLHLGSLEYCRLARPPNTHLQQHHPPRDHRQSVPPALTRSQRTRPCVQ